LPRDTKAVVADLHAVLRAAKLPAPSLYVGHSIAGLNGILFADTDAQCLQITYWTSLDSEGKSFQALPSSTQPDLDSAELDAAKRDRTPLHLTILTAGTHLKFPGLTDA